MESWFVGAGLFQIWGFYTVDFLHILPGRGSRKKQSLLALSCWCFLFIHALHYPNSEGQIWFPLPCGLIRTKAILFWKVQFVCSKYQGSKVYPFLLRMAALSHFPVSFLCDCVRLCFCLCSRFALFLNLKPGHSLSFWMSSIFCSPWGVFFPLSIASCLRRRQKCSLARLLFSRKCVHAFSTAVWLVSWADSVFCARRLVMHTPLPCKNSRARRIPTGPWMQTLSYLHTWLCDRSLLNALHV